MEDNMKKIIGMLMAENISFNLCLDDYPGFLTSPIEIQSTIGPVELWEIDILERGTILLYHGWKKINATPNCEEIIQEIKKIEEENLKLS